MNYTGKDLKRVAPQAGAVIVEGKKPTRVHDSKEAVGNHLAQG